MLDLDQVGLDQRSAWRRGGHASKARYAGGSPIFHVVVRSRWGDVGGMTPGPLNGAATDILQEGLRLNYVKLPEDGRSEILRMILDNVRATAEATADLHAVLDAEAPQPTDVWTRGDMRAGTRIAGAALIEEMPATTFLPRG